MNTTSDRVLCVGAAHWDIIGTSSGAVAPGDDVPGRIIRRPGGVAMNVALGLAVRGVEVALCSIVGRDAPGEALIQHAVAAGVDCSLVVHVDDATTGHYVAIQDQQGELVAAVADTALLRAHDPMIAARLKHVMCQFDVVFIEANLSPEILFAVAGLAVVAEVEVVVNPVSPVKASALDQILTATHAPAIIANLKEANSLLRCNQTQSPDAARDLVRRGASSALITNGREAVALATSAALHVKTPPSLTNDVSVTGAGDALLAAYLAHADRRSTPEVALEAAVAAATDHMKMRD